MNVQVVSDQKLLNCYLSGDRNAISQLIERHSRRVRDALLFGPKFQGDRRTDRCQHQHGAGAYAIRADQSSENDQGKKPDFKLEEAQ